MKRKLLLICVALLCTVGTWATTDYTSRMSNNQANWDGGNGRKAAYGDGVETFRGNTTPFSIGDVLFQTINSLPNGYYQISFYAWENFSEWEETNAIAYGDNIAQVFANTSVQDITVIKDRGGRDWDAANTYTLLATVTDGTLKYGVKNIASGGNWAVCKAISLTYLGTGTEYYGTSDKADCTSLILNPSFETGNMTGWAVRRENNVVNPGTLSDCGVKPVASYPLSNSDGDYIMNYYGWSWSCDPVNGIEQTIPDLPAGTYRIEAVLGGWAPRKAKEENEITPWEIVLKVNNEELKKDMDTDNAGVSFSVDITLASTSNLTITAKMYHKDQNEWEACFMKADNFRLYNLDHYYDALNAAIEAAEEKTLGFEEGEYAPYNNVAAITALNAAKAVNQDNYDISWSELETIVSNLTSATWTVNMELMNAIYDGQFASYDEEDLDKSLKENSIKMPGGWIFGDDSGTNTIDHIRQIATFSSFTGGRAMFFHPGSVTYGQKTGYTMPLKANSVYKLSFQYAGWYDKGKGEAHGTYAPSVSILNESSEGRVLAALPDGADSPNIGATSYIVYFATDATPGSYKFTYASPNNITNSTIGNMSLIRVDDLEFADGSVPNYVAGTYPSVKISRTLTANRWATAVYPFAVQKSSDLAIATISEYDKETGELTFGAPDASTANTPFLMRSTADATEISLSDVTVAAASVTNATANEAHLIGTYSRTDITDAAKNYVLSDNVIYPVGEAGATIPAYRAYFQIDQDALSAKALTLVFNDEATAVSEVKNEGMQGEKSIYNLAGQRMNKLQRGVNIVNGKKLLVK